MTKKKGGRNAYLFSDIPNISAISDISDFKDTNIKEKTISETQQNIIITDKGYFKHKNDATFVEPTLKKNIINYKITISKDEDDIQYYRTIIDDINNTKNNYKNKNKIIYYDYENNKIIVENIKKQQDKSMDERNLIKPKRNNDDFTFYTKLLPENADDLKLQNDVLTLEELVKYYPNIKNDQLNKLFKGGDSLLDSGINDQVKSEYNLYCNYIQSKSDTFIRRSLDIRTTCNEFIKNIIQHGNIVIDNPPGGRIELPNLTSFIKSNYTEHNNNIKIDIGYKYKFNSIDDIQYNLREGSSVSSIMEPYDYERDGLASYNLEYKYYDYNKNIVESFQKKFIENNQNIQNLIISHMNYINFNLDARAKYVINDYTNPQGYSFYAKYYKSGLNNWFQIYKGLAPSVRIPSSGQTIEPEYINHRFMFGDAFYHQIKQYMDECLIPYIEATILAGNRDIIDQNLLTFYDDYRGRRFSFNDRRNTMNEQSHFHNILSQEDWNYIFYMYECELNQIILNAPKTTAPIEVYRGTDRHVFVNQYATNNPNISLNFYLTARPTSFTIDYTIAKSFYLSNSGAIDGYNVKSTACLYRTNILPGCSLLFIEQLTTCTGEYEFIVASNTCIIDPEGFDERTNASSSLLPSSHEYSISSNQNLKYNNIKNSTGIYGTSDDSVKSRDILIIGSLPPPPARPMPFRHEVLS